MAASIDLTGQTFGRLVVIGKSSERSASGSIKWVCQCSCGKSLLVRTDSLKNGHTTSCGCFNREQSFIKNANNLTGKVFGRITVLSLDSKKAKYGERYWLCQCSCGTIKTIIGASLTKGLVKSCGCLATEIKSRLIKIRNHNYRLANGLKEPPEVLKARYKHKKFRQNILLRDDNKCVLCGCGENLHIHHIVPLCQEIVDEKLNLITLCVHCHEHLAHDYKNRAIVNETMQHLLINYLKFLF